VLFRSNVISRKINDFHIRTLCFGFDENDNCVLEEVFDENDNLIERNTIEFNENNLAVSKSEFYLDTVRGTAHGNSKSRYEYEFW